MSGSVLRLQGSVLAQTRRQDDATILELRPAYLIQSENMPAVDPSTLWIQDVDLIFQDAAWRDDVPTPEGLVLTGGDITLNGITHLDLLPMPLNLPGAIELELRGEAGTFVVRGAHFELRPLGVGQYRGHI